MSHPGEAVVVVLAGGASRRYGRDKMAELLEPTLASLPAHLPVVVVGPQRPTGREVTWAREQPPLAGPVAACAAGLAAAPPAAAVVLLAGDMPRVGLAVPALLEALTASAADVAVLTDGSAVRQPLAAAWRVLPLARRLEDLPPDAPLRALLQDVEVLEVADRWEAATDVDVPS